MGKGLLSGARAHASPRLLHAGKGTLIRLGATKLPKVIQQGTVLSTLALAAKKCGRKIHTRVCGVAKDVSGEGRTHSMTRELLGVTTPGRLLEAVNRISPLRHRLGEDVADDVHISVALLCQIGYIEREVERPPCKDLIPQTIGCPGER